MAKYDVERACGHTETVDLYGPRKNREWRIENVEAEKLCRECYLAKLAEERELANKQAAEEAQAQGLPKLEGTEKQVAWAETIRQEVLAAIDEFIVEDEAEDPRVIELISHIKSKVSASWWIDHRETSNYRIRRLLEAAIDEVNTLKLESHPAAQDAKAEATVRPENPVTETVAEIRIQGNVVEVSFPERRDDFREIVKRKLNMEWMRGSQSWQRTISLADGTPADRAAEAGHRLLAAGFCIRIYDPELRKKAIDGNYEPESTRWIFRRTGGDYDGWFSLSWNRGEDYYGVAKRLPGSRWDKPNVVVPPEQFEEVLDFADMYGFSLSPGAEELVAQARQIKERALVADVEASDDMKVIVGTTPSVLEVPQEVEIVEELRDED
jgi:hypothetical protein